MKSFIVVFAISAIIAGQAKNAQAIETKAVKIPACSQHQHLGHFNTETDLLISNFDSKTDVDDLHSIAALATLLRSSEFQCVRYYAVAGAYGIQDGDYIPAPKLFQLAFGDRALDAHKQRTKTSQFLANELIDTLQQGGDVWIQEAGQSDLSAELVTAAMRLKTERHSDIDIANRVHVVQHSEWNESVTTASKLDFIKQHTHYIKVADGNASSNGTPGFITADDALWKNLLDHSDVGAIWREAKRIADLENPPPGYVNQSIEKGGMDFSDTVELSYIFGFQDMQGPQDFFNRFLRPSPEHTE